jgi:hypothetical protein
MARHETVRSVVHNFLKNRNASPSDSGIFKLFQENEHKVAMATIINTVRSSYRLITVVEEEQKGHLINFIAELLDPQALAEEV